MVLCIGSPIFIAGGEMPLVLRWWCVWGGSDERGELPVQTLALPPAFAFERLQKWSLAWGHGRNRTGGREPMQEAASLDLAPGGALAGPTTGTLDICFGSHIYLCGGCGMKTVACLASDIAMDIFEKYCNIFQSVR